MKEKTWFVYILRCANGKYYTGFTANIARRISEHETGANPTAYTYSRRPVELVWVGKFNAKNEALAFEQQVKGWNRKKKEALIQNDWNLIHQIVKDERKRREN